MGLIFSVIVPGLDENSRVDVSVRFAVPVLEVADSLGHAHHGRGLRLRLVFHVLQRGVQVLKFKT